MEAAETAGCDAALLVHEHAIVDGDRATPLVLMKTARCDGLGLRGWR